ncbi:MAG: redox-regulated ATPase YchF [Dehalococcoidales bacterium]|nr:redox-regulated ATPase YchF [Dehalococcoidales bacterium]
MSLSCGLVGIPTSGKTTIFNAITAAGAAAYSGTEMNRAVVNIPDSRVEKMVSMYHPRKTILSTLEVVDIPGLKAGTQIDGKSRGSRLLAHIKDVDAVLHVVRCFEDPNVPFEYETIHPARDVDTIDLELMAADSLTLQNKIERVGKRAKSGFKDAQIDLSNCTKVYAGIQQGVPARKQGLTVEEKASVYDCNLVSLKPMLYIANIKSVDEMDNKHVAALKQIAAAEQAGMISICGRDEADVSELEPADRPEFLKSLGLTESSMERLMQAAYRLLGLTTFFTVGEDEVRAWTCHKGDKAPVAAGKIHSDMEKGFIRMEVIKYTDLIELGNEDAVIKAQKKHVESRDYEVQNGDIVQVLFNS